jgi:hypothetical protein
MPESDFDNLKSRVDNHDSELSTHMTDIVNLKRRVDALEKDVKTLVFLCHYIREFAHVHPGKEDALEKFNAAFSELM